MMLWRRKHTDELPVSHTATVEELALIAKYREYTMTPPQRRYALLNAVNCLDRRGIAGDIVECGVWRGGNCIMVKEQRNGRTIQRNIYLFDTFGGMTEPTARDLPQKESLTAWALKIGAHRCSLHDVKQNFTRFDITLDGVVFVEGAVEKTLHQEANLPETIALLRLDTDFYEFTRVELEILYPRLVSGGVLIVDDYDHWQGCRIAVDEFFGNHGPLLSPIDQESRIAVRP